MHYHNTIQIISEEVGGKINPTNFTSEVVKKLNY